MNKAGDFIIENDVLIKYVGTGSSVTIPQCVREIGQAAFSKHRTLVNVEIPDSVEAIGDGAFADCHKLWRIRFPAGLKRLGSGALRNCVDVLSLVFPEGLESIGSHAFDGCVNCFRVGLPGSLREIGPAAFSGCTCEIRFHRWIPSMKEALIGHKGILHTEDSPDTIPERFRTAALTGFAREKNTDFNSPRTRSYLEYARLHVEELTDEAFRHPELLQLLCTRGLIPAGELEAWLREAEKSGSKEQKALLRAYAGAFAADRLVRARKGRREAGDPVLEAKAGRLALMEALADIAGRRFVLDGTPLEETLSDLEDWLERHGAVVEPALTEKTDFCVVFPDGDRTALPEAERSGTVVIDEDRFLHMVGRSYPDTRSVKVPEWLREFPSGACRNHSELCGVTLPDGMTRIGAQAFQDCIYMWYFSIAKTVCEIGDSAFRRCRMLNSFWCPPCLTRLGAEVFRDCSCLSKIELPDSLTRLGDGAFRGCHSLTEIKIPDGITALGDMTFRECSNLRKIDLPAGLSAIGRRAFNGCRNLTELSLPAGLLLVGEGAFAGCVRLRELRLPASLREIGESAFRGCPELTLRAPAGSFAESWARAHSMKFEALN